MRDVREQTDDVFSLMVSAKSEKASLIAGKITPETS